MKNIEFVLEKLKKYYNVENMSQLSRKLNVSTAVISNWKSRNSVGAAIDALLKVDPDAFYILCFQKEKQENMNDSLHIQTISLLNDIRLVISTNELNQLLKKILIDKIISKFKQEKTILYKILEVLKLEDEEPVRPFLFLYYIFRFIIQDSRKKDISSYKEYLIDVIQSFNTKSLANGPIFTKNIINDFVAAIEYKLSESECKILIENAKSVLENLESRMPMRIIKFHRSINLKSLFPNKFL